LRKTKINKICEMVAIYLIVLIAGAFMMLPVVWMFLSSLIPEGQLLLFSKYLKLPDRLTLKHYIDAFFGPASGDIVNSLKNSIIIALLSTSISIIVGSLAAYAFVRLKFKGRRTILLSVLVFQMMPALLFLIPLYVMLRTLGLWDTILGVVSIQSLGFLAPYATWLLVSFLPSVPVELEESALIDGCNRIQVLIRIVLPLMAPALAAVAVFCFLGSWGDFLLYVIATSTQARTLPLTIALGTGEFYIRYGYMSAISVTGVVPPLILAILFQKYLTKGLMAGAIKG